MINYKMRFDFGKRKNGVQLYLNKLSDNSINYIQTQKDNKEILGTDKDLYGVVKAIRYVEEYLYFMSFVYPDDFNRILNTIINNVDIVSCLPLNKRGIYGEAIPSKKIVQINPNLRGSNYLTSDERIRLYMAHELGHMINNVWMNKVLNHLNEMVKDKEISLEDAQLMYDGFSLLDEATTQERAETLTYIMSIKNRPHQQYYINPKLFNGESYKSNFDYYGELQAPATMFARTLRGLGKINDDDSVLSMLSSRAVSSDFFDKILYEYTRDNQLPSFYLELKQMGLLKRAAYANFGYGDASYCKNSLKYLNDFKKTSSSMRDYRDEFSQNL